MNLQDIDIKDEAETDANMTATPVSVFLDDIIASLMDLARACQSEKTIESAEAACRGSRTTWRVIHQAAVEESISDAVYRRAEEGISACLTAIMASSADPDRIKMISRNVRIRLELVRLLRSKGLAVAEEQMKKIMRHEEVTTVS